jgi:hypothetical protein
VAAVPYESACEENSQCSARMGQGSSCLSGKCVCKEGFHYLQGICHKSSGKIKLSLCFRHDATKLYIGTDIDFIASSVTTIIDVGFGCFINEKIALNSMG